MQSIAVIFTSLIISEGCLSLVDAFRDIDTKDLVRDDSKLTRDNVSPSINLEDLLNSHRARVEKDKGVAMTMVLRDLDSTNATMLAEEACLDTPNGCNNKVLFYKKLGEEGKQVKLELEWFLQHDQVEISSNLVNTDINLCPSSVLSLLSDKYDSQTMGDFIKGVLNNEEVLDSHIYWEQLRSEEYAVPVTSWRTYCVLSREILQRYSYLFVPDMLPHLRNPRSTNKHRRDVHAVAGSTIAPSAKIGNNVLMLNSVIGPYTVIKDNCVIVTSTVNAYATLESNVKIFDCVINAYVHMREGSTCHNQVFN